MAIAQAVIEYLHHEVGCKTLVSTHFHELAHLEESLRHLRNYSMAVKESGGQVTFLRRLIRGAASTSYGIYCAEVAGLPAPIIQRSYELLNALSLHPVYPDADEQVRESAAAAEDSCTEKPPAEAEPQGAVQLSFFAGEEEPRGLPSAKDTAKPQGDEAAEKVISRLKGLDLINMTPLQAMNVIFELKQHLQ